MVTALTAKVVRSLEDLEAALAIAASQGECRIKVGNQVAFLVGTETLSAYHADDFLSQSVMVQRLDKATRSLQDGCGISHADVQKRFSFGNPRHRRNSSYEICE